jgi:fructose-specific PTS system IIA-like component
MAEELSFRFPLAGGLHARPAAALRLRALALGPCRLINDRSGRSAALDDLLALLATDTHPEDPCRILAEGPGAAAALAELGAYLDGAFLACDEPVAVLPGELGTVLPALLARTGAAWWQGLAVAPGLGQGTVVALAEHAASDKNEQIIISNPESEIESLHRAVQSLTAKLDCEARDAANKVQRELLEAHAAMLADRAWIGAVEARINRDFFAAFAAVNYESAIFVENYRSSTRAYLRERALDMEDLRDRLSAELTGRQPFAEVPDLTHPTVLVGPDLSPSRFLALDRTMLRGLVLTQAGGTSHTAILARSFGIPTVAGMEPVLRAGQEVLVDGGRGLLIADPPATLLAYYRAELPGPAPTGAGQPQITLRANLLSSRETGPAMAQGADGVGLLRTEMLFMDRAAPPDEAEQFRAYREVLAAAGGRPVVLRLLDVGGDKPLPYLPLAAEANPFLGCRGVRWYPAQPDLIRTQIRAALRAGAEGDLRLLVPMVAEVEEMEAVRALLTECGEALAKEGLAHAPAPPLGVMVEVPAALLNLDALARVADFFCVGSNDLVQYLFAADRGSTTVAKAAFDWHPATLRALAAIVEGGHRAGVPVSLCGEMAGRPRLLPLLLGLGFRELSLAPALLPAARTTLASLDPAACAELARQALAAGTAREVEALLQAQPCLRTDGALLDPALVLSAPRCESKEEAIRLLVQGLADQGRTRDPLALEEAVWARERVYATGIGFGFALPHCKSAAATASLAMLRLGQGLDWGGADADPVDCILLLAMPAAAGDEHLRVIARLARKLVSEPFRAALKAAPDPAAVVALLQTNLL